MPTFYLPKIPLHDPMLDTTEESLQRITSMTNRNFDIVKRLMYGQLHCVKVRHGGILLENLTGGFMPETPDVLGAGLNLTNSHMGYFDGETWQAYIDDDGRFYFGGDTDNYIFWDGAQLDIAGHLNAVTGTFEVLAAGDLDSSFIAMGTSEGEPILEMYDVNNTLRVRLEKDRMSFYTEELYDEEEELTDASIYAGMIQGLYWKDGVFGNTPEVRIEVPNYCNILAVDSDYDKKFARSTYINNDSTVESKIQAINLPSEGGSLFVDEMESTVLLNKDIILSSKYGSIYGRNLLELNSEEFNDHLAISRYDSEEEKTYAMFISPEISNKSVALCMVEDTDKIIIYAGTTALMEINKNASGWSGSTATSHVIIYGDLAVQGDYY